MDAGLLIWTKKRVNQIDDKGDDSHPVTSIWKCYLYKSHSNITRYDV